MVSFVTTCCFSMTSYIFSAKKLHSPHNFITMVPCVTVRYSFQSCHSLLPNLILLISFLEFAFNCIFLPSRFFPVLDYHQLLTYRSCGAAGALDIVTLSCCQINAPLKRYFRWSCLASMTINRQYRVTYNASRAVTPIAAVTTCINFGSCRRGHGTVF